MTLIDVLFIGMGLAVDASCVSASNGMTYKLNMIDTMKLALIFAIFQGVMPLIGYFGVGLFSFELFEYNRIVALVLLSVLGGEMIYESLGEQQEEKEINTNHKLLGSMMLIQGITTSIDALSIGITFHNYDVRFVLYAVILIAIITFIMCAIAVRIGIEIGTRLNSKAELVGGLVLIFLGIKIFIVG